MADTELPAGDYAPLQPQGRAWVGSQRPGFCHSRGMYHHGHSEYEDRGTEIWIAFGRGFSRTFFTGHSEAWGLRGAVCIYL